MKRRQRKLTEGSVQHQVSLMHVGEVKWIETTPDEYAYVQRTWNLPKSRRVPSTKDMVLVCSVWTAVGPVVGMPPAVLVRVERTA